ncbi:DUF58 domain-containing protein [Polaromonas sp. LjRoot131]|uniref:DUF58 domain-containing protein n=1 Tax=Polaromonas sp. LjRoot131 TaxID=3342262 RepID=UPI003ECDC93A
MERWLSKPRVLLALSGVLLLSALNRHDPMVFGMFLFLATLSVLGLLLPWLSLRSLQVLASGTSETVEGQASNVQLLVERRAWWPAFMVDVETHWQWGPRTIVLSHTLPLIRARQRCALGHQITFPCRGDYRLAKVVLASGFPLGLVTARRTMAQQGVAVLVLPRAQEVFLPADLSAAHDPLGNQVTHRLGQSFELGNLRHYVAGEPLGRVNWRASARSGELVIQQFQQSGSPLLHVVTDIPSGNELARPDAPSEQALRVVAGLCEAAEEAGARIRAYLPQQAEALRDTLAIRRALAGAMPDSLPLREALGRVQGRLSEGSQLLVVVSPRWAASLLMREFSALDLGRCPVTVYIATHPAQAVGDQALAPALALALAQAGFQVISHYPGQR